MDGDFGAKLDMLLSNPAMMAQIKTLADTMTGNADATSAPSAPTSAPSPGSAPVSSAGSESAPPQEAVPALFSPSPGLDQNMKNMRALLLALKPYLDEKRREKLDKMLHMMRLAEMAGYFKNLF